MGSKWPSDSWPVTGRAMWRLEVVTVSQYNLEASAGTKRDVDSRFNCFSGRFSGGGGDTGLRYSGVG